MLIKSTYVTIILLLHFVRSPVFIECTPGHRLESFTIINTEYLAANIQREPGCTFVYPECDAHNRTSYKLRWFPS